MPKGTNQKFKFTYLMRIMLEKTDICFDNNSTKMLYYFHFCCQCSGASGFQHRSVDADVCFERSTISTFFIRVLNDNCLIGQYIRVNNARIIVDGDSLVDSTYHFISFL